ncbi:unnamed protein product [Effrenium voratum]|uniref:ubiquitinyl hydrolase 1 n=1 Tax=Effrenium voratum TaxID=2562239 RepID=A0AA36IM97_9DINO|nr:unnamed protein product [Effrenium voratum]
MSQQKGIRVSVKKTFLHFSFVDAPAPCKRTFSCPAQLEDVQAFEKSGDTMGSLGSSEMSDDSSQLRRQDCGRSSASQPSQEASESPVGSNVGPSNSRGKTKTEGDLPVCCVVYQGVKSEGDLPSLGYTACKSPTRSQPSPLGIQKQINKEILTMAEQGNRELLEAVGRHLQQMSGVNLATAFHRLARAKDSKGSKEIFDRTLQAMMDRAELLAGQDMMYQDGSMPPNCCTLIAWSCATLGTFRNSLFSMLTTNTLRSLPHCQIYELTNLLWSYAQLKKLSKVGQLLPNLRNLTDAVMKLFLDAGVKNVKVQVLISALVSVASLPGGASASWLFAEISEELAQRWDELPIRKRSQVVLAFQLMRNQNRDLVQKTVKSVARRCPDMSSVAMELLGPVPEIVLWYLLTMVFDAVLRQQPYKLSATGQELGSSMLFSSRIGFSGTPSSLLPEELGECLFEAENEGEILSVLSDEQHVVPPLIEMPADWSPESILITVAKSKDPVYHCLIDTGALVMGFTNEEVAKLLLKMLSEELFDGVAYFDDHDAPMVFLRGAVKPALLSEAGVPMERRFTFFDQVHTTGTDTKQPLQCFAALTLSASMTFRDYAQGAWRMRGLGKGQKLRMMITPELAKKVAGAVGAEGSLGLHDAVAFMLSNQFDSEGKQFAALQLQNLATVWRRTCLQKLMAAEEPQQREQMRAEVESFLESLRFPVETKVQEPLKLHEKMAKMAEEQVAVMDDEGKAHCDELVDRAQSGGGSEGGELGAEITRQQEKEQEKQQEKEKEVEVHVGREREREVEWPIKVLLESELPEAVLLPFGQM